jgi:hypothetical protein
LAVHRSFADIELDSKDPEVAKKSKSFAMRGIGAWLDNREEFTIFSNLLT